VVGAEQQGGVLVRAGQPRRRAAQLVVLKVRCPRRSPGGVPPVHGPSCPAELPFHHRRETARIRSATLSWQRGRWHVAFSVELPDHEPASRPDGRVVGVDLGIKSLAVLSTGQVVPNPRHLGCALRALRCAGRQASRRRGPNRRTRTVASNRWRKTKERIAALHGVRVVRTGDLHGLVRAGA